MSNELWFRSILWSGEKVWGRAVPSNNVPLIRHSTVSKIVHQSQYQGVFDEKETSQPIRHSLYQQAQRLSAECALFERTQDCQSKGVSVSRPRVRKEAAVLPCNAWNRSSEPELDDSAPIEEYYEAAHQDGWQGKYGHNSKSVPGI